MKRKLLVGSILVFLLGVTGYSYLTQFYAVPILMYHYVNDDDPNNTSIVSASAFASHMEYIRKKGYEVISLDELVQAIKTNKKLKHSKVVITFDDGYADNYLNAFPIIKEYNYSVIIFLAAKDILDRPGMLSIDQIKEMQKFNISFGAHSFGIYDYLPDMKPAEYAAAVKDSKTILEKKINSPILYFSYPIGGYTDEIMQLVKEAGYKGAVTTNRGPDKRNRDIYALKRIKMTNRDVNPFYMWAKLSGYYNLFRKVKVPD